MTVTSNSAQWEDFSSFVLVSQPAEPTSGMNLKIWYNLERMGKSMLFTFEANSDAVCPEIDWSKLMFIKFITIDASFVVWQDTSP